ncbi:MAG TPA: DUF885 domain-containing protein [Candidatus Limnocylindrales bacterium]|nr:DUF885 domain-containing protein [Candidatus Limnocylindrales bacterium]
MTQTAPPLAGSPTSEIDRLADGFWERFLELSPVSATVQGDSRYDDRLPDPGPAGRAKLRALAEDMRAAADALAGDDLPVEDRITRDVLGVVASLFLAEEAMRLDTLEVIDQMGGPQTVLPQLTQFQAADTPERLEAFLARLQAYPDYMAANAELLREALASGLTAPRIVAERTVAQLERMLAIPLDQAVVPSMIQVAGDADRERIRDAVRDLVYPADAAFLATLKGPYLAATRTEPGIWSAPNGEAIYRSQVLHWTTLELDPRDIHATGLAELESIEAERRAISRAAGLGDDTKAYRARLAADPASAPETREELLARTRRQIEAAEAASPSMFGRLPRAACRVVTVEEFKEQDAPPAYYYPPSADSSRPGTFYINAYDLPSRQAWKLTAYTFHEAVPGHHLQIALDTENPSLNQFRRFAARFAAGSFVEGWGLYAERLADEMGLYRDEGERFGMLDAQAWRAARLVVDTGIHALRWSRQQGIDQMLEAGLSETDAVIETDRYIAHPGQALAYKIGQREIERLRRQLTARDGAAFDLKAFHDQVLGHGSLPLATLAAELPDWLAAKPLD